MSLAGKVYEMKTLTNAIAIMVLRVSSMKRPSSILNRRLGLRLVLFFLYMVINFGSS